MSVTVKMILQEKGRSIVRVNEHDSLLHAVRKLIEHGVGSALILNEDETIAGIFSERNVVKVLEELEGDCLTINVGEAMTRDVMCCREEDSAGSLMKRMTDGRFRHMPVVDEYHKVIGVVSIGDVVKSRIQEIEMEVNAMRNYILQ